MAIPEKLVKFKFHFIFVALFSLIILALFLLAPRFLTILSYFWPLFLSTALFLAAVVLFGQFSPPVAAEVLTEKAGEGILDYVAGQPLEDRRLKEEETEEPQKSE